MQWSTPCPAVKECTGCLPFHLNCLPRTSRPVSPTYVGNSSGGLPVDSFTGRLSSYLGPKALLPQLLDCLESESMPNSPVRSPPTTMFGRKTLQFPGLASNSESNPFDDAPQLIGTVFGPMPLVGSSWLVPIVLD